MLNKRGDDKYYILISLILGLIVLCLCLYFIFQEYFTSEDIDWEACRQSVILRANLPEASKFGVKLVSFKNDFPLKCKTQVFDITKEDIIKNEAGKIIANTMVQCWGIFGNGDFDIFPMDSYGLSSFCVPCARIHLTGDAKKYLIDNPSAKIDIEGSLDTIGIEGLSFKAYLNGVGEQFSPFTIGYARDFYLGENKFEVDEDDEKEGTVRNRRTGAEESGWTFLWMGFEFSKISLPKYMDSEQGDLLINFGSIKSADKEGVGANIPYLFYFQVDQRPDPFSEVKHRAVDADNYLGAPITSTFTGIWEPSLCENWEGIPA